MIEVLRDKDGTILAFIEWLLLDEDGKLSDKGNIMMIGELEIAPTYRGNGIMRKFITILYDKNPQAEHCAFVREYKYTDRPVKIYKREQFKRYLGR